MLRDVTETDLPVFFEQQLDPEATSMAGSSGAGRSPAGRSRSFLQLADERPLHAGVTRHNVGSMRVLEKCGFARCGEEDEMVLFKLGG